MAPARQRDVMVRVLRDFARDSAVPIDTTRGSLIFETIARTALSAPPKLLAEPDTVEWLDELRDEPCLWDIGANVGGFSLYASLSTTQRVVAFEPAASSFAMLMRNIELNQMSDRVSAYCLALSAEPKLDMLNMWDTDPGGWMNSFGIETNQFGESIPVSFRQPTMGFSIDDFVRTFDPPLPSHFKMDVDGLEAMILRGGRETLSSPMVRSAIVEIEGDLASEHNREILAVMDGLGFEARPKASPKLRNVVFDRSSGKRT